MADAPFGASFGNPRQYMGSSGIGPAVKTGLTAYAMQKSGLTDWLNNLNKPAEQQTVVQGAVPLPRSFDKYLAANPEPVVPPGAVQPKIAPAASPMQIEQPEMQQPLPTQQELGHDWLNGKLSSLGSLASSFLG